MASTYAAQGLVVLGVNCYNEPKSGIADFAKSNKLTHVLLLSGKSVALRYGLTGIPATFWLDPRGVVQATEVGFDLPAMEENTRRLVETAAVSAAGVNH